MILWAFAPHTIETAPAWEGAPLRAWRWALAVDRGLVLEEQMRSEDDPLWEWGRANRYLGLYLTRREWRFGFYHLYYDGPHHSLWLGPINIAWMRNAVCPVCEDGEPDNSIAGWIERILTAAMGRDIGDASPPL